MNIYIGAVCGTLMAGIARLAREAGHEVAGCDANTYPPMDGQLKALGVRVDLISDSETADDPGRDADCFVIGNALSRGHALVERVLRERLRFCSGPAWLFDNVLRRRDVAAVAGTHGKTTTTSMLAWILSKCGRAPGFLIGGMPEGFEASARLGKDVFVVEADEYDTAFFDKRPKFLHYFPRILVLNNLDYDHADIYPDIAAIKTQFAYLLRTVSGDGKVLWCGDDANLRDVMGGGCHAPAERFGEGDDADWRLVSHSDAQSSFAFSYGGESAECALRMPGRHNALNALAAIAAAAQFGVEPGRAAGALASFGGVRRRLEVRAQTADATVYDDFAHHPRAIRASLEGVRGRAGAARVVAVFEPRSNTMKRGCHNAELAAAFARADRVLCYVPPGWSGAGAFAAHADAETYADEDALWTDLHDDLRAAGRAETHYVVMSNGGFFGLAARLADAAGEGR